MAMMKVEIQKFLSFLQRRARMLMSWLASMPTLTIGGFMISRVITAAPRPPHTERSHEQLRQLGG